MKTKSFLRLIILLVGFIIGVNADGSLPAQSTSSTELDGSQMAISTLSNVDSTYVIATYENHTGLDGCGWLIRLESGRVLEPDRLDSSYMKLGKSFWLKYSPREGGSICMVGQLVTVIDIQPRIEEK